MNAELYIENQLDLGLLKGMSCYFLDEEKWINKFHYDMLWRMYSSVKKVTSGIAEEIGPCVENKQEWDSAVNCILENMFKVLTPLLDIMKGLVTEAEYTNLMEHFLWIESSAAWMDRMKQGKMALEFKKIIEPLALESDWYYSDRRIRLEMERLEKEAKDE